MEKREREREQRGANKKGKERERSGAAELRTIWEEVRIESMVIQMLMPSCVWLIMKYAIVSDSISLSAELV